MKLTIKMIIGFAMSLIGIASRFIIWVNGRKKERLDRAEKTLENVRKSNIAASTDEYDDKLREKYGIEE